MTSSKKSKVNIDLLEPVYSNRFEVEFTSTILSDDEKELLKSMVISIIPGQVRFRMNVKGRSILPLESLYKLRDEKNPSNIVVNLLNKDGSIFSSLIYSSCEFTVNLSDLANLSYESTNLSWGDTFQPKEVSLEFTHERLCLNQKEIYV